MFTGYVQMTIQKQNKLFFRILNKLSKNMCIK